MLSEFFEERGYQTATAGTCMVGLRLADEYSPDPVIPIILVSGDVEITREEALDLLPEPRPILLRKPFSLKDLMSTVRSCAPIDEVSVE